MLNVTATATHPEHLFSLHSGGVRSLCFKLDKLYRDWLGEYLKTGADIPHQKEG